MARVEIRSDIQGVVWQIETQVGAGVEAEEPVIILESMKMEIPVPAPATGTITEIRVGHGDLVEENQVVAILET